MQPPIELADGRVAKGGYDRTRPQSSLSHNAFTHDGTTYTVDQLVVADSDPGTSLSLTVSPPFSGLSDHFVLELQTADQSFDVRDALVDLTSVRGAAVYTWKDSGVDWVDLDRDFAHLRTVPRFRGNFDWLHIPDGIRAGEKFRLMFVTFAALNATSSDIEVYNRFVQAEAGAEYSDRRVRAAATKFRALVSTAEVDARDNTAMLDEGVPIYWIGGDWSPGRLVANNYEDFYDGDWMAEERGSRGSYVTGNSKHFDGNFQIFTGTRGDGTGKPNHEMGAPFSVAVGTPNNSTDDVGPLGGEQGGGAFMVVDRDEIRPIYGMSPVFTAIGGPPGKPRNVSGIANGDNSKVILSWDRPSHDGGYDLQGYRVYWHNPSKGYKWEILRHEVPGKDEDGDDILVTVDVELDANTTSWVDKSGRSRIYGVVAFNEEGESDYARYLCTASNGCMGAVLDARWSMVPDGLEFGDTFRILFISSTQRNANAYDIYWYNEFVQGLMASGFDDIKDRSAGFRAVVCTEDVDARDNTNTTGAGVPIYWMNGKKAADGYEDFYDGSWDEEASVADESGTTVTVPNTTATYTAWVGCDHDGTEGMDSGTSIALGRALAGIGNLNYADDENGPLTRGGSARAKTASHYIYGLSQVFRVTSDDDD